jgi:hypothetical protein
MIDALAPLFETVIGRSSHRHEEERDDQEDEAKS